MSLTLICRCSDPAFECVISTLSADSTVTSLVSAFEDASSVKGPFTVTRGKSTIDTSDVVASLKSIGLVNGDSIEFKPSQGGQKLHNNIAISNILVGKAQIRAGEDSQSKVSTSGGEVVKGSQKKEEFVSALNDGVGEDGDDEEWGEEGGWDDSGSEDEEDAKLREADENAAARRVTQRNQRDIERQLSTEEGDDSDSSDLEDMALSGVTVPTLQRQRSYVVMGELEVGEQQKKILDRVVVILQCSQSDAVTMLRKYDWKESELIRDYEADANKVRKEFKLEPLKNPWSLETMLGLGVSPAGDDDGDDDEEIDCELCFDSVPKRETYALECDHIACINCWRNWCVSEFEEKGMQSMYSTCIHYGCTTLIDHDFFMKILPKASQRESAAKWHRDGFVQQNAFLRFCTRPGCNKAVWYDKEGMKTVTCVCGNSFCFNCGNPAHDPAPCKYVKKWNAKNKSDAGLVEWLNAKLEKNKDNRMEGVKRCTKCQTIIEKNQGCKHMTCKHCRHEFCWLCYQDWRGHDESKCSTLQQEEDHMQEGKENAQDDMKRYQWFYDRFNNHFDAIKFAHKTRDQAVSKSKELHKMYENAIDINKTKTLKDLEDTAMQLDSSRVEFLVHAVDEVVMVRSFLAWCYTWQFFLPGTAKVRYLLRNHVVNLERYVETLHEMVEQPLSRFQEERVRTQVIGLTRVMSRYRKSLIGFAKSVEDKAEKDGKKDKNKDKK